MPHNFRNIGLNQFLREFLESARKINLKSCKTELKHENLKIMEMHRTIE
jgi:hypothetical protein